jgi:hypothetical protein
MLTLNGQERAQFESILSEQVGASKRGRETNIQRYLAKAPGCHGSCDEILGR